MNDEYKPQREAAPLPATASAPAEVARPARDAKGRLLPGQRTLNPAGRPPRSVRVRTLARGYTREAIETLVEVMRDSRSADARTRAATALLDRGWGRPAQQLRAEVSGAPAITINLPWLEGRSLVTAGRGGFKDSTQRSRLVDAAEAGSDDNGSV